MKKGVLYLIPTVIADDTENEIISRQVREVVSGLDYFLVENLRTARRYISKLDLGLIIDNLQFEILDRKTDPQAVSQMLTVVLSGRSAGIMSESGCPGIADPGSVAVAQAHQMGIQVVPLSGPSSVFMALMGSGFNGQSFVFHGYVPIDKKERVEKIRSMEADARKLNQTQIFMDTPYRNEKLLESLISSCHPETKLSIARGITGKDELIQTKTIGNWKKIKLKLDKTPTIFSIFV